MPFTNVVQNQKDRRHEMKQTEQKNLHDLEALLSTSETSDPLIISINRGQVC